MAIVPTEFIVVEDDDYSHPEWCGECSAELSNGRCWFCDSAWIWTAR